MQTVFAGLSGGVDSAVSAALLKDAGYRVTGAFIKIWQPEFTECTWREDRLDAMRVCAHLGIPFREIDLSAEYERAVVEDMIRGYAAGLTPNPDTLCNRSIKFGAFASWAFSEGADMIATGHYAQIGGDAPHRTLLRAADAGKDQSYFLYQLTEHDLSRALFPVGGFEKRRVRQMAAAYGLPVAAKRDSQGLCFVGGITLKDFLSRFISLAPGPVLDMSGAVIGEHDGAALYTTGQRHGLRFSRPDAAGAPHFVARTDVQANTVTVSTHPEDAAVCNISLADAVWVNGVPDTGRGYRVQVRYHGEMIPCTLAQADGGFTLQLHERCIASRGQAAVLYDGDRVLGGGVIAAAA